MTENLMGRLEGGGGWTGVSASGEPRGQQETLLLTAGHAMRLGGWRVNLETMRVLWSDEVATIHDMPPGHSPSVEEGIAFYAPEWRQRISEVFEACAREGTPYDEEMEILTGRGRRVWVRTVGEAVRDDSGTVVGVHGAIQEITPRNSAEEALRHRLSYQSLLSRISTMAVEAEDTTEFQSQCVAILGEGMSVSRAYVFEYRPETDTVDNTHEWCAPGVKPQMARLQGVPSRDVAWWNETLRKGQAISFSDITEIPHQGVVEILQAQGILSVLVVPLFAGGRYFGFLGFDDCRSHREWAQEDVEILQTITGIIAGVIDRQEAHHRLEEERSQLLSIFDSVDEPIYVIDPATYEVLFVNRAAKNTHGKDPIGGICYRELNGLEEPCSFCTNEIIQVNRGETYRWEHHHSVLGRTFSAHDRIIRWPDGRDVRMELAIDITEQKRTEEQLQAALKMEAVGSLAGGIAHDFNNLLSVILNSATFVLEGLREGDPLREDVLEIQKAGKRAAALTRQLLAFSRRQVLEPRVLDPNETLAAMDSMLRRMVGEDVRFNQILAPDLGRVKVDPGQLEQVVMNLVSNSRDAMPEGGKLTIETANAELDEAYAQGHVTVKPGSYVRLAVSDTGCGMDEATRRRVFEPFFTTKEMGKGTGLGLSTVYGIVKQSGGYIWAYGEPGKGSTFKVYLPRVMEELEAREEAVKPGEPPRGTETVLVVEDEEVVRTVVARMLRAAGYHVLTASNGGEGLLICEEHQEEIHLLITDVVMPRMSGSQLAERLQRLRPGLPVLYMSGYTDNSIVHHGVLDLGPSFIGKPFSGLDLRKKVQQALRGGGSPSA